MPPSDLTLPASLGCHAVPVSLVGYTHPCLHCGHAMFWPFVTLVRLDRALPSLGPVAVWTADLGLSAANDLVRDGWDRRPERSAWLRTGGPREGQWSCSKCKAASHGPLIGLDAAQLWPHEPEDAIAWPPALAENAPVLVLPRLRPAPTRAAWAAALEGALAALPPPPAAGTAVRAGRGAVIRTDAERAALERRLRLALAAAPQA